MKELAGTWKCENPDKSILPVQGLNVFAEAGLLVAKTCCIAEAPRKVQWPHGGYADSHMKSGRRKNSP